MNEVQDKDEPGLKVLRGFDKQLIRGRRGIVTVVLAALMLVCGNIFVWVVPPPNIGGKPWLPPEVAYLLPLSIATLVVFCISLIVLSFLSIWTTMNPPPLNGQSHGQGLLAVIILGTILLVTGVVTKPAGERGHFRFSFGVRAVP